MKSKSMKLSNRIYQIVLISIAIIIGIVCLVPLINVIAISFSSSEYVIAGEVKLLPKGFNLESYKYIFGQSAFWSSLWVSIKKVVIGLSLNMILTVTAAYPLSKKDSKFRFRTIFAWFFFFTMLFGGGTLPWYFEIKMLGLLDTIWALVLPGAVNVFGIIILLNFFKQIPPELEEAAKIDGANQWQILFKVYIPLSMGPIATVALINFVGHWNAWFDGIMLITNPENMPLQSYIHTIVSQSVSDIYKYQTGHEFSIMCDQTIKSALITASIIPIILMFPLMQRFLSTGIVMGSTNE